MPIDNKLIDNLLKDYKTPEEIPASYVEPVPNGTAHPITSMQME